MRERELLAYLGLPPCPYKHGHSARVTTWIQKGLLYSTKSSTRYFLKDDIEDFLKRTYGISIEDFKQHLKDKEKLSYTGVEYI